jgi:hypothetical protein
MRMRTRVNAECISWCCSDSIKNYILVCHRLGNTDVAYRDRYCPIGCNELCLVGVEGGLARRLRQHRHRRLPQHRRLEQIKYTVISHYRTTFWILLILLFDSVVGWSGYLNRIRIKKLKISATNQIKHCLKTVLKSQETLHEGAIHRLKKLTFT